MRNLKKFLALVLAMMMAMSLMITANAAVSENKDFTDSSKVTEAFADDIAVLIGMNIMKGKADSGELDPKGDVTRAEMAAFVYRLATGDATDSRAHLYIGYGTDSVKFTDVRDDAWYAGYVGYCANAGYIKGYGDGTFRPTQKVTGYEALAMILRAMGYDKHGEFSGFDWRVKVGQIATERRMLAKVNETVYANDLYGAANRELAAELVFQGATKPVVKETTAFGYQVYQQGTSGALNDSLGKTWYNLEQTRRVILGNQYTGEPNTVLGAAYADLSTDVSVGNIPTAAYTYPGTSVILPGDPDENGEAQKSPLNADGLRINWETDLHQFGHEVEVWYKNSGAIKDVYALFDRCLSSEVVVGTKRDTTVIPSLSDRSSYAVDDTYDGLGYLATSAGFSSFGDGAAWSYSFGRVQTYALEAPVTGQWNSPIVINNNGDGNHDMPAYLLINNPSNSNGVDMVVVLNVQVTDIQQENTVRATKTVSVATGDSGATSAENYFDVFDYQNAEYAAPDLSTINMKALVGDSAKTLGDRVVAIQITGTTGTNDGVPTAIPVTDGTGNFTGNGGSTKLTSTYYYQLAKLTPTKTAVVVDVDIDDGTVTLQGGEKLERSWLADTTADNAHCLPNSLLPDMYATYDFYLDEDGKYILWDRTIQGQKFVYGTYLDYQTALGTSSFDYKLVGVDIEGKRVEAPVTKYIADGTTTAKTLDMAIYTDIQLPKRDSKSGLGGVQPGKYMGYTVNSDGTVFDANLETVNGGNNDTAKYVKSTDVYQADNSGSTRYSLGGAKIAIDDTVTKIGAIKVNDVAATEALYFTEDTTFILVSNSGTDTQKIEIKNGLNDFLGSYSKATIDLTERLTEYTDPALENGDGVIDQTYMWELAFMTTSAYTYAQNYNITAYKVDTIIMPKAAVEYESSTTGSLFFVGNSYSALHNAWGEHATKYTVYDAKGDAYSRWIQGWNVELDEGDDELSTNIIVQNGDNVFYNLVDTGLKANDGEPIYKVQTISSGDKLLGQYYTLEGDVPAVKMAQGNRTELASADTTAAYAYIAATRNSQVATIDWKPVDGNDSCLFNVASANVTNLNTKYFPGVSNGGVGDLNAASSLQTNVGVEVSCVLNSSTSIAQVFMNYGFNPQTP